MNRYPFILLSVTILLATVCSCSTTRRIPEGEMLYTGTKGVDIRMPAKSPEYQVLNSQISSAVKAKPNNSLFGSSKYRIPFPLGLWVYNNWPNPEHGFKHWIFQKLASDPVLISDVRPEVRVHMIDEILQNNGFFQGSASYQLLQGKNKKKAAIEYTVLPGKAYPIDSVILLPDTCRLNHLVDSVCMRSANFRNGARYSTDSLSALRVDVANLMRNKGYYFFRPEYIEYLADSTIKPGSMVMKLSLADNLPPAALWCYSTGKITTHVYRNGGGGTPDTSFTNRGTIIRMLPSKLREGVLQQCITFREGKTFSVRDMNRTQSYLARLGIFNGIDMEVSLDTIALKRGEHMLDVDISCTFDKPMEVGVEVNVSSKSNSYIGPGANITVTNRNTFGGGELLTVGLSGSYEWQTGKSANRRAFNSYEFGLNASLAFPRLVAPDLRHRRHAQNWTRAAIGIDLLNRPHYFKMSQFNASWGYDWRISRESNMSWTVFKLTYNKLLKTTSEFDSIMSANRAIALSFRDQFVPQMSFNYIFDHTFDRWNIINIQLGGLEAGNLFWAIYEACGKHGAKTLFGTPFSQFIKGTAQVVFSRKFKHDQWIVSRIATGVAHPYGNSKQVPYADQFYVGGANSIRAFTVRSLGPGSYKPAKGTPNGYFDQTGNFKLEANVEYRFPIVGPLHGALFVDAGNVWLLEKDPARPGGELKGSTFWKDIALGTGAGLRFDIGMMVIRADLGIGLHAPYNTGRSRYYNMTSFKNSLAFHLAIGYPF